MQYQIAALYKFVAIPHPAALRDALIARFAPETLRGTLLIAPEGINGTLAGTPEAVDQLLAFLFQTTGLNREEVKFAPAGVLPFHRLKFRLKREIIAFRQATADPSRAGTYVAPQDWNALLADPEVLLLDTRNQHEYEVGSFQNAVNPQIDRFSDFAGFALRHLDPARHKKVAMFCTGGIRCEKASAYLLAQGFPQVFHLKGGILKYLEEVPAEQSLYQGQCFVFDDRRGVTSEDLTSTHNPANSELRIEN